ncbi:MAG: hypothetical protein WBF71_07625 [Microthrixaceae bacterium]
MIEFELQLEESEWEAVMSKVIPFCAPDERFGKGMVAIAGSNGLRRWWSTDNHRMARLDGAADDRDYLLLVSPRILAAWPLAAGDTESATISIVSEDPPERGPAGFGADDPDDQTKLVVISGAGGSFSLPLLPVVYPPVDDFAAQYDRQGGPTAEVDAAGLHLLASFSRDAPTGPFLDESREEPTFLLGIFPGALSARVEWHELGMNTYSTPALTEGAGEIAVNPRFIAEAVEVLDPGPVRVRLPTEEDTPLVITQEGFTAYVMPMDEMLAIVSTVEEVLEQCFGIDVRVPNLAGDYELSSYGVPVYARVVADEPPRVRIFAELIAEIEASPELLHELNALNLGYGFVKVLWIEGSLVVEGDLVAETIDPAEVTALFERVRHVAEELGPSLAAVYGGVSTQRGDIARWAEYLRTVVLVSVGPGITIDLTGPSAEAVWPFEDEVHVLTAWDPAGRKRPTEVNNEQNALLAADVMRLGGSLLQSSGYTPPDAPVAAREDTPVDVAGGEPGPESGEEPDERAAQVGGAELKAPAGGVQNDGGVGEFVDSGFLVWGLDTETILAIARSYGQEAVYRLTADTLEVVGAFTDRTERRPRLAHPSNTAS